MNVTLDVSTSLVVIAALVVGCLVYRWTAPVPGAVVQTSKGERLMWAVSAAAAAIVVGSYLADGIKDVEREDKKDRAASLTTQRTDTGAPYRAPRAEGGLRARVTPGAHGQGQPRRHHRRRGPDPSWR
ncbi:hypothetical protein GPA10_39290 [Streptomyces sp. p1417]|uniref:Uncharacterized protein n=1 Tax=Streptomyces typhae TaxID=2681492 RepID=A0A6L6X9R5_9ACTN|nr:hypothetical protein [Streptomyces typhae]MVO90638.1 hypothetical protein [Streptomyces typhae]